MVLEKIWILLEITNPHIYVYIVEWNRKYMKVQLITI